MWNVIHLLRDTLERSEFFAKQPLSTTRDVHTASDPSFLAVKMILEHFSFQTLIWQLICKRKHDWLSVKHQSTDVLLLFTIRFDTELRIQTINH